MYHSLDTIASGLVTGYYYLNPSKLSGLIIPAVFIMIYPMMVNLSLTISRRLKAQQSH